MKEEINIQVPGRICLFGDHQDYLGFPVIACAIDRSMNLKALRNNSDYFLVSMPDIQEEIKIHFTDESNESPPNNLLFSALRVLRRKGLYINTGYHIIIKSNIPINAGISSSSALIIAWIQFLLSAFGNKNWLSRKTIARLAYEAEVTELQAPGGNMDQITIAMGGIVFIETHMEFSCYPLFGETGVMVLANSGIPKDTTGLLSQIRVRTQESFDRIRDIVPNFVPSDIAPAEIMDYEKYLPEELKGYFRAAIKNHSITKQAKIEFEKEETDPTALGVLMNDHHEVLRDELKITVPEIDLLVDTAVDHGAFGVKMVGSGGGGCIVALTDEDRKEELIQALLKNGAISAYEVKVSPGLIFDAHA
jgi:galactokinase